MLNKLLDRLLAKCGLCRIEDVRKLESALYDCDMHVLCLESQLAVEPQSPADGLPFCVNCHGQLHRKDGGYSVISFRHDQCPTKSTDESNYQSERNLSLATAGENPKTSLASYDDWSDLELPESTVSE